MQSEEPRYVTRGGIEYVIESSWQGWLVRPYALGRRPKRFAQHYSSFAKAEAALITWLKETDSVLGHAVYPGSPPRRDTDWTTESLRNWIRINRGV